MFMSPKAGRTAWWYKIAYDESIAKYAPGLLQLIEMTNRVFETRWVDMFDSASVQGTVVDGIWADRQDIVDILVPADRTGARHAALAAFLERSRRSTRTRAKSCYHGLASMTLLRRP